MWYYGEEEFGDINIVFEQFCGYCLCQFCFVQYYWDDWMFVWKQSKVEIFQVGLLVMGIVEQVFVQIIVFFDQLDCF